MTYTRPYATTNSNHNYFLSNFVMESQPSVGEAEEINFVIS